MCFFSSRRRHTRYWRDWSSDVCSSDLGTAERVHPRARARGWREGRGAASTSVLAGDPAVDEGAVLGDEGVHRLQIGRASCRERVEISVVAVSLKKKYYES